MWHVRLSILSGETKRLSKTGKHTRKLSVEWSSANIGQIFGLSSYQNITLTENHVLCHKSWILLSATFIPNSFSYGKCLFFFFFY
jgi:hypothetical protein